MINIVSLMDKGQEVSIAMELITPSIPNGAFTSWLANYLQRPRHDAPQVSITHFIHSTNLPEHWLPLC